MADVESTVFAPPFGSLTPAQAAKLGEQAFLVAAHAVLRERDPQQWETPAQFAESVAQAFEALLTARGDRDGTGFLAVGYGKWAEDQLAKVPRGFRPMYEAGRLKRVRDKAEKAFGGRSEAKGGGEAPLQSGARID